MTQILQELDREWSQLAPSPPARRALMRWAATHPGLAGHHDLDGVLAVRRDRERSGPMLATLAPDLATILRTRLGEERLTDIAAERQATVRLLRQIGPWRGKKLRGAERAQRRAQPRRRGGRLIRRRHPAGSRRGDQRLYRGGHPSP